MNASRLLSCVFPRGNPLGDALVGTWRWVRKTLSSPWVNRFRGRPDSTRGGAGSSCRWRGLAVAVFVCALTIPAAGQETPTHEGFDYSASTLAGENGGAGNRKGAPPPNFINHEWMVNPAS